MRSLSRIFALILLFGVTGLEGYEFPDYSYQNTEEWGKEYPACNGQSQSPIDIPLKEGIDTLQVEKKLTFIGYDNKPESMTFVNEGHSLKVQPIWSSDSDIPYLTGGPVGDKEYVFEQFHFHWGENDKVGSDHTFDGESGVVEAHFAHWNRKYGSLDDALEHEDGLVILAAVYHPSDQFSQQGIMKVMENVDKPIHENTTEAFPPFPVSDFDAISMTREYVTYFGSIIIPPCSEVVTWLVALDEFYIATDEVAKLRKFVIQRHGDDRNYRPTQKLNDRKLRIVESE